MSTVSTFLPGDNAPLRRGKRPGFYQVALGNQPDLNGVSAYLLPVTYQSGVNGKRAGYGNALDGFNGVGHSRKSPRSFHPATKHRAAKMSKAMMRARVMVCLRSFFSIPLALEIVPVLPVNTLLAVQIVFRNAVGIVLCAAGY